MVVEGVCLKSIVGRYKFQYTAINAFRLLKMGVITFVLNPIMIGEADSTR